MTDTAFQDAIQTATPQEVVRAIYQLLSGAPDEQRDFAKLRSLFDQSARLATCITMPDGEQRGGNWTLGQFFDEFLDEYLVSGCAMQEFSSRVEECGTIAHVFSTYQTTVFGPTTPLVRRGVNSIQLQHHAGRWWIMNVLIQLETHLTPIPERFLTADTGG